MLKKIPSRVLRFVASLFAVLLVCGSLSPAAFAADPEPLASESAADDTSAQEQSKAKQPAEEPIGEEPSAPSSSLMDSEESPPPIQQISTIKQLLPETDASTGALISTYPLVVPPGRNGLQPDIKLTYNSQHADVNGILGNGWSDNIPYIERINRTGSEKLYTENFFTSSLSGELVDLGSGSFKPKVENGEFLTYTLSSSVWTVKDKKGTVYKFGTNAAERQDNPSDSTKVYKWMLQEVRDTNNNYIKYEYYKDAGEIYPSKIKYTGNNTTDGIFEIEFLRESRGDAFTTRKAAFAITTSYRIYQILAKVSGAWTRKYEITYTTADNGNSSSLQTVKETGRDETTEVTVVKPQNQYSYSAVTKSWTEQTSNWDLPSDLFFSRYYNGADKGGRVVDVNGDALPDLLIAFNDYSSGDRRIYLNNGSGWTLNTSWTIPSAIWTAQANERSTGVEIADVNGDGLPDFLLSFHDTIDTQAVYLNNGSNGWTEQTTNWQLPAIFFAQASTLDPGGRVSDINGDGLADLFISHYIPTASPPTVDQRVYVNNGTGWTQNTSWTFPSDFHLSNYYQGYDVGTRLLDINGDGLLDAITHLQENATTFKKKTYLNTGTGWVEETSSWTVPGNILFSNWQSRDQGGRVGDLNGDGLPDLFMIRLNYPSGTYDKYLYLNNGENGWTDVTSSWSLPDIKFTWSYTMFDQGARLADLNGDGLEDMLISQFENGGSHDQRVFLHNGAKPNLATTLTYESGGSTSVTYKTTPQYTSGSALSNPKLPHILHTVYQLSNDSAFGVTSTSTFKYEDGLYYYSDAFNRQFAGFEKVTKTDSASNAVKTFYHQGNTTNSSIGEYSDHASKMGKPYRIERLDSSGNKYAVTISKWDKYNQGTGRDFVKLLRTVDFTYDGDTDHKDKAVEYTYEDATGNLTQKVEWGEVTGADSGTFTDTGSDKLTTDIAYAANSTAYIHLPKTETVTNQSAAKVRESKFYYDGQSHGTVNVGNLTKEEKWKTGSSYINTQKTYNTTYGLVTSDTDPRGKTTSYSYDTHNLYPATVTQPHSLATQYTYDYSSGQVKQTTDPNSLVFQTVYDGLDRVVEEKQPDHTTPSSLVTKTAYAYTDTSGAVKVQKTDYLDGSTSVDTYTYFDGFHRPIQTRAEMEDSNTFAVTDTIYNNVEQVHKESLPYSSSGSAKTSATTTADLLITYSYDPLLRVTSIQNAAGTTSSTYDDWKLTATDPRTKPKHLYKDARGLLWKVEEVNSGNTYTTLYEYNGNGDLTKITDSLSNIRNFTYDGLGRRLTAEDLHASGDSTFGTWTYTYDDSGNLTSSVDPKSQTVNYTYDDINRVLTENYTGQSGTEVTYSYDTCTNGKPRLCSVTATGANTTYAYNPLGGVKQEVKTIASTNYQTDYTHDRQGNVLEIASPDSSKVKYTYNTAGLLETIQRKESSGSAFQDLVTDFDYGPHGKVTYQANANETATTNTYDATELYRLSRRLTTGPGGMGGLSAGEAGMSLFEGEGLLGGDLSLKAQALIEEVGITVATPEEYVAEGNATKEQDGAVVLKQPQELTTERSATSKTFLTGFTKDGDEVHRLQLFQKDVHYTDLATGQLRPIDTAFEPTAGGFAVTKAPYRAEVKTNTLDAFLTFQNKRDRISLSLVGKNGAGVTGQLTGTRETRQTIRYESAIGQGIDLEVSPDQTQVRKDVVIQNKAALGDLKGKEYYELLFKLTSNLRLTLKDAQGKALTAAEPITTTEAVTLTDSIGIETYLWPAVALEANGTRAVRVPIRYELKNDGIYLTKLIPVAWLETAQYPVRTDAVLSVYATASGDGEIYHTHTTWNGIHDATSGTAENTPATAYAYTEDAGSDFWMARVALPFDTSALPDNATISAADLKLYIDAKSDGDNDANAFLRIVQNTTASATALANGDFDQIGAIDNPTAGSSDTDITGITTGQYLTIPLNSTGRGWISLTGYTKLGLREGHDATDTAPDDSTFTGVRIKTADASGTSQDPILEITYTTGNSAPTAPTSLLAEGQTNPTGVTDPTPEFSAIYNDPDGSDTATHYKLQVSTSASFTTTVWDSGQVALSPAVSQGQRSPDIAFGGTPLDLDGTTYYWRIKFWDNSAAEGAWSSNGQFTMDNGGSPTTVTFYSTTSGDGEIYHGDTASWTTIHDATSGTADAISDTAWVYSEDAGDDTWLARIALPFDTGGLPDGASISSATLYVYVDTKSDQDNDGSDFVRVVKNTTASSTALADGDFDQIGTVDNPQAGSTDTDITGITTGQYLAIPLSTAGNGWISKTGYTKLGLREGHDATDTPVAADTLTGIRIKTADATGTSQDPKLEITYTTGTPHPEVIQDLNYTYDANGNILTITDDSDTDSAKLTTYTYDDLNRLLTATVTGAVNGDNTTKTYTYSAIGNITSGDAGSYTYAGTNYANPHAATTIGSATYSYDNNGNLTGEGTWTHTWDYRNRLTQSAKTGLTATFAYDHAGSRVSQSNGTITTVYPTKQYNIQTAGGSEVTKHIFGYSRDTGKNRT